MKPDRYFDPTLRAPARQLYDTVAELPLICPHGHVDPALFASADYRFGTPVDLLIIPDHYVFRMLYSQGIPLEQLGIQPQDGTPIETDHCKIWQLVADHWYLFAGTPTGIWLRDELASVFGIAEPLNSANAGEIYDTISDNLASPAFTPRTLYDKFRIEALATTDAATDTLALHQQIRDADWAGRVIPTFRPDAVVNIDTPGWQANIHLLTEVSGITITDYQSFLEAIEQRRAFFKAMGATATDHAALSADTTPLTDHEADIIFQKALTATADETDAARFTAHMLYQMARMSTEDGLVMQLHIGSYRNHNAPLHQRFGRDKGADIPLRAEFTRALRPLLNSFGNNPALTLVLFTLDESTYGRELAPLAGHYPALRLGPPWWFFDSWNGMSRYFDQIMETAGIYNTAGFNDDTRAFPSIPARHDMWRRATANWVASLLVRGLITDDDAHRMIRALAYDLAKQTYNL